MTDSAPTTSVIIPVFNGAAHICEAIDSVASQLDDRDEIIVIDDGSDDDTPKLLQAYGTSISVLRTSTQGPSAARNIGIAAATGEFIAFLDHDDLWPAGRHRELLTALRSDTNADAAAGKIRLLIEEKAVVHSYLRALDGRHEISILMSCLYRRAFIERIGLFDTSLRSAEDTDFHQRQIEAGMKVIQCEVESLVYRRHASNSTNTKTQINQGMLNVLARKLARHRQRETN